MLSDIDTDQVLPAEDTSTEPDVIASSKLETLEDVLVPPGPYQQVWDKYLLFGIVKLKYLFLCRSKHWKKNDPSTIKPSCQPFFSD